MSNDAIPVALTNIYSYLVNGNLAKAHAFYPKSDYINGIDLVCDLEDISCSSDDGKCKQSFMEYLPIGLEETGTMISLYRHAIVDLNILRMVLLESAKALVNGRALPKESNSPVEFHSSALTNDYQLTMTGDHSDSCDTDFLVILDHIKSV